MPLRTALMPLTIALAGPARSAREIVPYNPDRAKGADGSAEWRAQSFEREPDAA
jgi:hypothetical protein